jgi:hypothetical protein
MFRVSTNGRFSVPFSPWRKRLVRWRRLSRCGILTRVTADRNLKYYLIEVDIVKLYGVILVQIFKSAKLTIRLRRGTSVSLLNCASYALPRADAGHRIFHSQFWNAGVTTNHSMTN